MGAGLVGVGILFMVGGLLSLHWHRNDRLTSWQPPTLLLASAVFLVAGMVTSMS